MLADARAKGELPFGAAALECPHYAMVIRKRAARRDEEELERLAPELREVARRARAVPLENPEARHGEPSGGEGEEQPGGTAVF